MAKKGDQAREAVRNKIIEAFGKDFVAFQDKKIYVQAQDGQGGETLQFAITMTMPKVPVAPSTSGGSAFDSPVSAAKQDTPVTMTPEDEQKVKDLMRNLGIA